MARFAAYRRCIRSKAPPRRAGGIVLAIFGACAGAAAWAEPAATPIDHPLFDANHCLTEIQRAAADGAVRFHWGCPKLKLITISCVYDGTGYLGLGRAFAQPGWHCNHPLPVLPDAQGLRVSDVAVGEPQGAPVWAACAVAELGEFSVREKPYHRSACYRALLRISRTVNRTGRSPREVAAEIPRPNPGAGGK